MRIVVQLKQDASERAGRTRAGGKPLPWLDRRLTPIHAGTSDPTLASFFEIDVDDPVEADRLVRRLLDDPSVNAAYIKPDDALPSM